MSGRERLRREDPVRTGPIRNWSALYRRSDSWDLREPPEQPKSAGQTGGGSCTDAVSHAVELGYRVIEEQIRQGQRVAEDLNRRSYAANAVGGDLREVADRAWRYYSDIGALWVDLLSSLAGDRDLLRGLFGAWPPPSESAPSASSKGAIAVSIEVSSARPARVTLDLHPHSERMALVCQALHALDAGKAPVTGVVFERGPDGHPSLRLHVPDAQPPGLYVGAVVDAESGQSRGTLSVSVS